MATQNEDEAGKVSPRATDEVLDALAGVQSRLDRALEKLESQSRLLRDILAHVSKENGASEYDLFDDEEWDEFY